MEERKDILKVTDLSIKAKSKIELRLLASSIDF